MATMPQDDLCMLGYRGGCQQVWCAIVAGALVQGRAVPPSAFMRCIHMLSADTVHPPTVHFLPALLLALRLGNLHAACLYCSQFVAHVGHLVTKRCARLCCWCSLPNLCPCTCVYQHPSRSDVTSTTRPSGDCLIPSEILICYDLQSSTSEFSCCSCWNRSTQLS
jgi:hypothetical protein